MEYQINTEQSAAIIDNGKIIATIKRLDNKYYSGYAVFKRDIGNYPTMVSAVYDSFDSAFKGFSDSELYPEDAPIQYSGTL